MKMRKGLVQVLTILAIVIAALSIATVSNATRYSSGSERLLKMDTPTYRWIKAGGSWTKGYAYNAGIKQSNGNETEKHMWKIYEYNKGTNGSATTEKNYNNAIYCLKAGVGFGSSNGSATSTKLYNVYADMKNPSTSDTSIINNYKNNIMASESGYTRQQKYNALIWVLDHCYVPTPSSSTDSTVPAYRTQLLTNAGISTSRINDDMIDLVQQLAIWYFTNNDEYKAGYTDTQGNPIGITTVTAKRANTEYQSVDEVFKVMTSSGATYLHQNADIDQLFKYFVNGGIANKNTNPSSTATSPVAFANSTAEAELSGNYYIVGPYKLNTVNSGVNYDLSLSAKEGSSTISVTLLNSNKQTTTSTIKQLVGSDFYIRLPKTVDINNVTFDVTWSINQNTITYLTIEGSETSEQPLAEVIPEVKTGRLSATPTYTPKTFDLSLRKYISKVQTGETVTTYESAGERNANVDVTKLKNGTSTTAEYKHRKDPVLVETGSKVTYKLNIYNEGDIEGRATKVIDQLPQGVKFLRVVSGNFDGSYNESTNTLTLNRKSSNTEDLTAYNGGNSLDSETIEIECEVTALPDENDDKIYTNIAWIAGYTSGNGSTAYVDRDSDAGTPTMPSSLVTTDNGYTNNDTHALNDATHYFAGQQDDDDFEKIKIKAIKGSYNMVLVKQDKNGTQLNKAATFKVNGVSKTVTGRLTIVENKIINVSNLNTVDTYTIEETVAPDHYCKFDGIIKVEVYKTERNGEYVVDYIKYYVNNVEVTSNRNDLNVYLNTDGNIYVEVKDYQFDLSLRKYISKVQTGETVTTYESAGERNANVDVTKLKNGTSTTAEYKHRKDPVLVETGSKVTYKLNIYNEGDIEGRATKVIDQLPQGVKFLRVVSGNFDGSYNESTNVVTLNRKSSATRDLTAYNGGNTLDSETIEIECEVIALPDENDDKIYTNIAWIAEYASNKGTYTDRDSDGNTPTMPSSLVTTDNGYTNNDTHALNDATHYFAGQQDDDDFEKIKIKAIKGSYSIELIKEDKNGNQINQNATFKVNGVSKTVTGRYTVANNVIINASNVNTVDTYTIEETVAPNKYCKFDGIIKVEVYKERRNDTYVVKEIKYYVNNVEVTSNRDDVKVTLGTDGNISIEVRNYQFDLSLRKYISNVETNGNITTFENAGERNANVDVTKLKNGTSTTAEYKHRKDPVLVETGSKVTYKLNIYNEGDIEGRATKVIDQLPQGVKFLRVVSGNFDGSYNESTNALTLNRKSSNTEDLTAYNGGNSLDSETIEIECEVTALPDENDDKIYTNIAWIAEYASNKGTYTDRDSDGNTPNIPELVTTDNGYTNNDTHALNDATHYFAGQQDDDDFEKIKIKAIKGSYNIILIKDDANGQRVNKQAKFTVNNEEKTVTGILTVVENKIINASNVNTVDTYTIKETVAPDKYCKFDGIIKVEVYKERRNDTYVVKEIKYYVNNVEVTSNRDDVKVYINADENICVEVRNYQFDLSLRKYISKVQTGETVTTYESAGERNANVDVTKLKNGTSTTAEYKHRKDPVLVETGSKVTYKLNIYNEGDIEGRATKVIDQLPQGVKFLRVVSGNFDGSYNESTNVVILNRKSSNTEDLTAYNGGNSLDSETIEIECEVTALPDENDDKIYTNIAWIAEYASNKGTYTDRDSDGNTPNIPELVTTDNGYTNNDTHALNDATYYFAGQQDDDDFEKIKIKAIKGSYNIILIKDDANGQRVNKQAKFTVNNEEKTVTGILTVVENKIINASNVNTVDTYTIKETVAPDKYCKFDGTIKVEVYKERRNDTYVVKEIKYYVNDVEVTSNRDDVKVYINADENICVEVRNYQFDLSLRKYISKVQTGETVTTYESAGERNANVDVTKLKNGTSTTAEYKHRKDPVLVETGSKVTYKLNIYNEGDIEGRATKVIDQLPQGVKFLRVVSGNFDGSYNESTNTLTLNRKSSNTEDLTAYNGGNSLDSETIEIECEVTALPDENDDKIYTNIAWIAEYASNKGTYTDRDSDGNTPNIPELVTTDNGYTNNDTHALNDATHYFAGQQDDDDFEKIKIKSVKGSYGIVLVKQDGKGKQLNETARFKVNGEEKNITGILTIVENKMINASNVNSVDTYTIEETEAPDTYSKFDGTIKVEVYKEQRDGRYVVKEIKYYVDNVEVTSNRDDLKVYLNTDGNIYVEVKDYQFDLALRKFVISIDGEELKSNNTTYAREPNIDLSKLKTGEETTAEYKHQKDPVNVSKESIVIYALRVYNEGDLDGYASEITDHLPEQLEFVNDEFNAGYGWTLDQNDDSGRTVRTNILERTDIDPENNLIKAYKGENELNYKEVQIKCKVKNVENFDKEITNIAEISKFTDENGNIITDRDSYVNPGVILPSDNDLPDYKGNSSNKSVLTDKNYHYKGQQDDDDFEKLIVREFDLALRKFITKIEDEEITSRIPQVDISKLRNGTSTTATYTHPKNPLIVETADIVEYTIRIFNEGDVAGYANVVKDDIPQGLQFLPQNELNVEYRWIMVDEEGNETDNVSEAVAITTDYLSKEQEQATGRDNLLDAFDSAKDTLDYRDVKVAFKVIAPNTYTGIITNKAQISDDEDENGNEVTDRDSTPDKWIEGEDDQDVEHIKLLYFDLALRKFITAVDDTAVTNRIPQFKITEDGKYVYEHTKEPVEVENGNIVTYTLRIFNEGPKAGYANLVKDDIPEGLEFLPENTLNKEYRWVMLDKDDNVTEDITKAESIVTDYLSIEQQRATGRNNLLQAFEPETMETPDYRDVKIAFKVTEPNTSDRIIINYAQISDDKDENGKEVTDIDSTPNKWIEGEDDQDIEKIKVKYFDLALRKWVTQAIVIENGQEIVTETGHHAEDDPEEVVKVELKYNTYKDVTVKFRYKIRITNEGQIAGYCTEISDYIPDGLKFVQADNPEWKEVEGKIVTDQLKDTLLQPGDTAEVEVLLTWINASDNFGLKVNVAEISKDKNDSNTPDIDSVPNNKKEGEDDIDDAPVILTVKTGVENVMSVVGIVAGSIAIISAGAILVKKFVL